MLQIENLNFAYNRRKKILSNINVTLRPGFTFLLGENGSGKTTFLKLVAGILPSKKSITFNGIQSESMSFKNELAYLPQAFEVYPSLKVNEILCFVAGLRGLDRHSVKEAVERAAESTNIENILDKKFKSCSGGIQRRVGLACILIGTPNLVLLDEPTVGIDPKERIQLYHILKDCFSDKTVIVSTHILDDIDVLADDILMLHDGQISYHGSYEEFCRILDGNVYTTDCPYSEIMEYHDITILSKSNRGGAPEVYRVYSPIALPSPQFTPVQASNEDIWIYHQSGGGDK